MKFNEITKQSYQEIKSYLEMQNYKICDYSFGILYMWSKCFNYKYAIYQDVLFLKGKDSIDSFPSYFFPIGNKSLQEKFDILQNHCQLKGYDVSFGMIPEEEKENLEKIMGVEAIEEQEWGDFLYDANLMATYTGKKYAKKRNHYHNFLKHYPEYSFEIINKQNLNKILSFYKEYQKNIHKDDYLFQNEEIVLLELLENYFEFPFIGSCLMVNKKVIAFTIGEVINDVLFVHIEKANIEYIGVYATMQKLFAEYCCNNFKIEFINREDDAGDPGLRQSKLSYNPLKILKKYKLTYSK